MKRFSAFPWACCSAALVLLAACPANVSAQEKPRKPNLVFILADDLGIHDLSCFGRKDQPTPNLDRLAKQGLRFTAAYSAASVCSPTRAALMTGKSPARLKLTTFLPGRRDAVSQLLLHPDIAQQLPGDIPTLAELLRAGGYRSPCIGKWHLGGKGAFADRPRFRPVSSRQGPDGAVGHRRGQGGIRSDHAGREIHRGQQGPAFFSLPGAQ